MEFGGCFRAGYSCEYQDEKTFVEFQVLFREAEAIFNNQSEIIQKVFSNLGLIK